MQNKIIETTEIIPYSYKEDSIIRLNNGYFKLAPHPTQELTLHDDSTLKKTELNETQYYSSLGSVSMSN